MLITKETSDIEKILIDFLCFLNKNGYINDYDFVYETQIKKFINQIKTNKMEEQKLNEVPQQALRKTDVVRSLSNEQIEMIADMFANREQMVIDESLGAEWILSHAFQLGAKFYRDFTNCA